MDKPNFASYNLKGLLALHNGVAKELRETYGQACPDRKAFKDKPKGIASCEAIWATVSGCRGEPSQNVANDSPATEQGETDQAAPGDTVENTMNDETTTEAIAPKKTRKAKAVKAVKAPKVAKAPKAAKAEGTGHRGRAPLYPDTAKLKALTKENPGREGTNSHEYYETIKASKNVGEYVAAGGSRKYLAWFIERGHATAG
jgi:hypothetical protein